MRQTATWTRPCLGVNFMAFDTRFHNTCCRRSGSPSTTPEGSITLATRMCLASAAGPLPSSAAPPIPATPNPCRLARPPRQPHLPGGDPRDVEQVVDEPDLGLDVAGNRLQAALGRFVVGSALAQHLGPAEDGAEGGPQLVRKHGEELVLRPVGHLHPLEEPRALLLGPSALLLGALALRDVARDLGSADDTAGFALDRRHGE